MPTSHSYLGRDPTTWETIASPRPLHQALSKPVRTSLVDRPRRAAKHFHPEPRTHRPTHKEDRFLTLQSRPDIFRNMILGHRCLLTCHIQACNSSGAWMQGLSTWQPPSMLNPMPSKCSQTPKRGRAAASAQHRLADHPVCTIHCHHSTARAMIYPLVDHHTPAIHKLALRSGRVAIPKTWEPGHLLLQACPKQGRIKVKRNRTCTERL